MKNYDRPRWIPIRRHQAFQWGYNPTSWSYTDHAFHTVCVMVRSSSNLLPIPHPHLPLCWSSALSAYRSASLCNIVFPWTKAWARIRSDARYGTFAHVHDHIHKNSLNPGWYKAHTIASIDSTVATGTDYDFSLCIVNIRKRSICLKMA